MLALVSNAMVAKFSMMKDNYKLPKQKHAKVQYAWQKESKILSPHQAASSLNNERRVSEVKFAHFINFSRNLPIFVKNVRFYTIKDKFSAQLPFQSRANGRLKAHYSNAVQ